MIRWILVIVVVVALDRALLWAEARGWINYRRRGYSAGAAGYHAGQLASIFTPGVERIQEAALDDAREEDDSGEPPEPPVILD